MFPVCRHFNRTAKTCIIYERRSGMKLRYEYSYQKYNDRYLAVVDFTETETERRILWVNDCGKTILELLQKEMTSEELIKAITERYSGDRTIIEKTIDSFIKQLSENGLIVSS